MTRDFGSAPLAAGNRVNAAKPVAAVVMLFLLAGCTSSVVKEETGLPNTAPAERGVVYLFAGYTPAGADLAESGMHRLTQSLRAAGVRADVYNPSFWSTAADDAARKPLGTPVAVVGYSLGGEAATKFSNRLKENGVAVQTLLVIEPYHPIPVACNVRKAIDIFVSDRGFTFASRLQPGKGFAGEIRKVNWSRFDPANVASNHWSVSKQEAALGFVRSALTGPGGVIRRPAPQSACLGQA